MEGDTAQARRQVLVSVHDVTPAHTVRIQKIFSLFSDIGLTQYALLVVPNYHGAWPLDEHPGFAADLHRRQEAGMEIFLHGLRHDEEGLRRTIGQALVAAGRTNREAEFLALSPADAATRVDRGLEILHRCGLNPVGFVPPAWLFGRGTVQIIRERDLPITEGILAVTHMHWRRRLMAPALGWDTRKRWLVKACAALAALRCLVERSRGIVRLAVHPQDVDDPVAGPSLRKTLRRLLETREAVSYRTALAVR
jgi:predicted deacetylase